MLVIGLDSSLHTERGNMIQSRIGNEEVDARVRRVIGKITDRKQGEVKGGMLLKADLGIGLTAMGPQFLDLQCALEKEFGVKIPKSMLPTWSQLADLKVKNVTALFQLLTMAS